MRITVTKKGAGRNLSGNRCKEGESIEVQQRAGRVYCAVGFATLNAAVKKPAKKKPAKKATAAYSTKVMEAEKPRDKDE